MAERKPQLFKAHGNATRLDASGEVVARPLCKATNVNYKAANGRMLLTQLNLTVNGGEMYAIVPFASEQKFLNLLGTTTYGTTR